MKRPTAFEIMRRNRRVLEEARELSGSEVAWAAHRADIQSDRLAEFADTADWLRDTRQQAQAKVAALTPRRPGLLRRAINYACGLGENA